MISFIYIDAFSTVCGRDGNCRRDVGLLQKLCLWFMIKGCAITVRTMYNQHKESYYMSGKPAVYSEQIEFPGHWNTEKLKIKRGRSGFSKLLRHSEMSDVSFKAPKQVKHVILTEVSRARCLTPRQFSNVLRHLFRPERPKSPCRSGSGCCRLETQDTLMCLPSAKSIWEKGSSRPEK